MKPLYSIQKGFISPKKYNDDVMPIHTEEPVESSDNLLSSEECSSEE